MEATKRIICLIDMDCFYVQVEQNAAKEFLGKPCGVCQYNPYKGGGLIAVNYEARKFNIKRGMRGDQAKELCPEFHAFFVNNKRGKADLTKYREASLKIFDLISNHCQSVEKASIDEAYLDLTDEVTKRLSNLETIKSSDLSTSFIVGSYSIEKSQDREENLRSWLEPISDIKNESNDTFLAVGALIVEEIRCDIRNTLGYNCSAGIANSKTLAKLCCGLNKPNRQTVLPHHAIETLYEKTQINQVRNLGGKLGIILNEELNLKTMSDLAKMELIDLVRRFGEKTGNWLWQISHGIDNEQVMSRQAPKSIGCSKNFRGKTALNTSSKVNHWLKQLSEELQERLDSDKERNQREANLLVIHITTDAGTFSKSTNLTKYCCKRFVEQAIELLKPFNKSKNDSWQPAIKTLGLSASKFIESAKSLNPLLKYFGHGNISKKEEEEIEEHEEYYKKDSSQEESSSDACVSSDNPNNLSDFIETMNAFENFDTKSIVEPSTSKSEEQNKSKSDKTSLDADYHFENNDCIVVSLSEDENSINSKRSKIKSNFFQPTSTTTEIENIEETDYVECKQCFKKILCWFMPEHEDFHYAQEISKQFTDFDRANNAANEETKNKKRSFDDSSSKDSSSTKKFAEKSIISTNKSKKPKTDGNLKSISNYFKKVDK